MRTLDIWDDHLATVGSQLLYARLRLLRDLVPHLQEAYREVSANQSEATAVYRSSLHDEAAEAIAMIRSVAPMIPPSTAVRSSLIGRAP